MDDALARRASAWAVVALDRFVASSPSAEERFRNSMQSSTASFRIESSRRHDTAATDAWESLARGDEAFVRCG
jgi:hypothetical protein